MVWIVGQNGMFGSELQRAFDLAMVPWIGTGKEVNVTDRVAIENFLLLQDGIDWIVNCAAYTKVDQAEDEPNICRDINVVGAENLAFCANKIGAALIHISTDYVFSGHSLRPYREADPTDPQCVYGVTKAEGERAVRVNCSRHIILRTAWLYGADGPNFVFTMLRLMRKREALSVVADQWGAPTWTGDLAQVVLGIIRNGGNNWGTYHASGEGECTWYEFAQAIFEEGKTRGWIDGNKFVEIRSLKSEDYPTKAVRPKWSVLSKEKLYHTFGLRFPVWRESLKTFLQTPIDPIRYQ